MRSHLDNIMHIVDRVDNAMAAKNDGQTPTLLDYATTIGCGAGVVVPPDDPVGQIGNKNMTSSHLRRQ